MQVVSERLPGRAADHLVASVLGLACLIFCVGAFTWGKAAPPPAVAVSSDAPDRHGLYSFDGKAVSQEWRWLLTLSRQAGWRGKLNSGVRSWKQQNRLHQKFVAGEGPPAFPADGPSKHMQRNAPEGWQHAVDVTNSKRLMQIASDSGVELTRPYPSEPWHLEAKQPFGEVAP